MTITGPNDTPPVPVTRRSPAINCPQCHNNVTAPDMLHAVVEDATTPPRCSARSRARPARTSGRAASSATPSATTRPPRTTASTTSRRPPAGPTRRTNKAGNWSALESIQSPNDLADLAGIQCESCHGPQGQREQRHPLHRGHRLRGAHLLVRGGLRELPPGVRLALLPVAVGAAGRRTAPTRTARSRSPRAAVEKSPDPNHCARCHSAQGFARYAKNLLAGLLRVPHQRRQAARRRPTRPPAATNTPATSATAQRPGA